MQECCYFHPKEVVIGVCHLCLHERLLILAAKQDLNSPSILVPSKRSYNTNNNNNNNNLFGKSSFPKIFSLGSSLLLGRKDSRHRCRRRRSRKSDPEFVEFDDHPGDTTSTSLEDESFISIKFGDNGVASWDKSTKTVSKVSLQHCSMSWGGQTSVKHGSHKGNNDTNSNKSVVEHAKPRAALRWRKRIGQLFQVINWKRSSKAGGGSSKGEGVKVVRNDDKGWIRTVRVRTKE